MSQSEIKNNMFIVLAYEIYEGSEILEQVESPVTLIHGQGKKLLPKIEEALIGKTPGDIVNVDIAPNEGFGIYDESLIIRDNISNVPEQFRKIDEIIAFVNKDGNKKDFKVVGIENDEITLDGNHYLCSKNLTYKITILDVRESTEYDREQDKLSLLNI
jgi:FKBP-type peptidyl-prolyl cis-trans isomerase SlyD